jgi:hypothetical protein
MKGAIRRFWKLLDSETVRLFVWPFYMGLFAFGVYAECWLNPVNALSAAMGSGHYELWVWTQITATLAVMIGLAVRHGGKPVAEMSSRLLWVDWMGLILQIGGHICMFWVLLDFEIYATRTINWTHDVVRIYAVFALAPYVLGCLFLALQVGRKIWHGEKLLKWSEAGR